MLAKGDPRPSAATRSFPARARSAAAYTALLALAASVWGCASSTKAGPGAEYVAMGSSFAAGPGVGSRQEGSPFLCARSSANYPRLLASALRMTLRDVTCSGATIDDILSRHQALQAPQIDAVGMRTRLVTVTIGGNDVSYLGNLAGESCANDRSRVPLIWRPIACSVAPSDRVEAAFRTLPGRLVEMVRSIRRRAPQARIVLVDYVTVLPASGTCPARTPLSVAQIVSGNSIARRLSEATAQASKSSGAILVQASKVTSGHDVCAPDPWVFGFEFPGSPFSWGPFSYHPNASGMSAVADAVAGAVRRSSAATGTSTTRV